MAQANATTLADFSGFIQADRAQAYFDEARQRSVVQQLVRRVPLGASGADIPYSTAKATAGWVSEAGQKPTTESAMALATIAPKKIAAISVVSAEVVRANPGNYMEILRADIAEAFAVAFDAAVLHGTSTPFGVNSYLDATVRTPVEIGTTTAAKGGVYGDVVAGMKELVDNGKKLTGFAWDLKAEPIFAGATDTTGRPLFTEMTNPTLDAPAPVIPGRTLGRRAFMGEGIATDIVAGTPNTGGIIGYGGDWSKALWGVVGGITYDVSTEATVTLGTDLVSLWEYNLVAIRAEAEYGWLLQDKDAFVQFTDHS